MAIGPVQLLVLGFTRPNFEGEIIEELERLRESDTVRVIDSLAVFKDAKKPAAERAADFAAQSADLLAQLKILDGHLAGRQWLALDRFTIADMALGSIVKRCLEFPIERPAFDELTRWQKSIDARPAFAVAIGAKPSALTSAA